jgi:hypothetical protein
MSWHFIDHACAKCGSRLIAHQEPGAAKPTYECGTCGAKAVGDHRSICGCGVLPKSSAVGPKFRCAVNPAPGPTDPSIIIITFDEVAA